jgi:hypothetical protein
MRHRLIGLLRLVDGLHARTQLFILTASFVIERIVDYSSSAPSLPLLPCSIGLLFGVGLIIDDLELVLDRGRRNLLRHQLIMLGGQHRETFLCLFLECFRLFQIQVWDGVLIL